MRRPLVPLLAALAYAPRVIAWGAAGHEIVATIAQIHLFPSTISQLCDVLPEYAKCHLAPVAAWADRVRMHMRWSGPLHYVNGVGDHPAQHCVFGQEGWAGAEGHNVLAAVRNTTLWLENGYDGAEEALKFLIHFVGDLHQPLHLTGRDKGGNGAKVRFDGRITNLHSVWDSRLIAKSLRTIPRNYTHPLPNARIEAALRGTIYDPYVRQIMYEGVLGRFADDIQEWISCPSVEDARVRVRSEYRGDTENEQVFLPADLGEDEVEGMKTPPARAPDTDDDIICPYAWAAPLHQLNCDIIWPLELDDPDYATLQPTQYLELDTPKYAGRIKDEWIVERVLAMGGIRLAAILNYIFAVDASA